MMEPAPAAVAPPLPAARASAFAASHGLGTSVVGMASPIGTPSIRRSSRLP